MARNGPDPVAASAPCRAGTHLHEPPQPGRGNLELAKRTNAKRTQPWPARRPSGRLSGRVWHTHAGPLWCSVNMSVGTFALSLLGGGRVLECSAVALADAGRPVALTRLAASNRRNPLTKVVPWHRSTQSSPGNGAWASEDESPLLSERVYSFCGAPDRSTHESVCTECVLFVSREHLVAATSRHVRFLRLQHETRWF